MNRSVDIPGLRRVAFGSLGVVATAFGLLVLLVPGLARVGPAAPLLDAIEGMAPGRVLLLAGALAVGALFVGARTAGDDSTGDEQLDRRLGQLATAPPEQVTAGQDQVAAAALDADVRIAIEEGGQPYRDLQTVLETTATAAYADAVGVTRDRAAETVAAGRWTRDPLAAALLAGEDGPTFGRGRTLRLLAVPARERDERIRRTIAAIERLEQQ